MFVIPSMVILACFACFSFVVLLGGIAIGRYYLFKRNYGEAVVANAIEKYFQKPNVLLNNVTFEGANGTTQIDHILVSEAGIFIIETKHYKGWIFGNVNSAHWTQVIYKWKSKFQNPVRQNYGHLKTIQSFFNLPEDTFIPLVVFSGDAELKGDFGPTVFRLPQFVNYLNEYRPVIFDERKMAYIVGRLEMKRKRRSLEMEEYHLSSVRRRVEARQKYSSGFFKPDQSLPS